jgi:hypothetical protein
VRTPGATRPPEAVGRVSFDDSPTGTATAALRRSPSLIGHIWIATIRSKTLFVLPGVVVALSADHAWLSGWSWPAVLPLLQNIFTPTIPPGG